MRAASVVRLDIHGVGVRVESDDAAAAEELRRDFAYFETSRGEAGRDVTVLLRREPPPQAPPGRLRWKGCSIRDAGALRTLDYEGRALAVYDLERERGVIRSEDPHLLHELGYLMVHSRAGRLLDLRGLHRAHALGFSFRGLGGLLLLPMGGGKTTLALELLAGHESFRLLSDDIPLVSRDGGRLLAFPQRLGVRGDPSAFPPESVSLFRRRRHGDKLLLDQSLWRGRLAAEAPLRWILVGTPPAAAGTAPEIRPLPAWRAAGSLAWGLLLGIGTPQVLELLLPGAPVLASAAAALRIAASRGRAAAGALRRGRFLRFRLGRDAAANASALARFLDAEKACA